MSDSRSGSDDDEAPEQVPFSATKAEARLEARLVSELAKKDKAALKQKRREKQELFKKQKLEKEARSLMFTDAVLDQIRSEADASSEVRPQKTPTPEFVAEAASCDSDVRTERRPKGPVVKAYKSLNIDVRALSHVHNPRRTAAVNFKVRRFGKVHRESVTLNQVHAEKLRAGGKL